MKSSSFHSLGLSALSIYFVVQKLGAISPSKSLLIAPFVNHRQLLNYLSNKRTNVMSLDQLITEKTSFFTNYNRRYYDSICDSINAIQFLREMDMIRLFDGELKPIIDFEFHEEMGRKVEKVFNASKNISEVLKENDDKLYLNLRVEL